MFDSSQLTTGWEEGEQGPFFAESAIIFPYRFHSFFILDLKHLLVPVPNISG